MRALDGARPRGTALRRVRGARGAGRRWDGKGLSREERDPRAGRGAEDPRAYLFGRRGLRAAVPEGSARGGPIEPSQHRPDLRLRMRGGHLLPRDGVRGRSLPAGSPRARPPRRARRDRAGPPRRCRPRGRPRRGDRSPRHQARQPDADRQEGPAQARRPRHRQAHGRGQGPDADGPGRGDAPVHFARADSRRERHRRARRHLLARRDPVPARHRACSVRGLVGGARDVDAPDASAARSAEVRAGALRGNLSGAAQDDGQGPERALPGRARARPGPLQAAARPDAGTGRAERERHRDLREHRSPATRPPRYGRLRPAAPLPLPSEPRAEAKPPTATPSASAPAPAFREEDLHFVEVELARHIGPLARVLVKRAAKSAPNLVALGAVLEKNVADEEGRRAFRALVRARAN